MAAAPPMGCCDPHRLGMAGAGHEAPEGDVVQAGVAILTDLEWPVLACRSAGPCRAPRSCDPHRLGLAGAGTLTGPTIGERGDALRSSPTWDGRCWDRAGRSPDA